MSHHQRYSSMLSRYSCEHWLENGLTERQLGKIEQDLEISIPAAIKASLQLIGSSLGIICIGGFSEFDMHAFLLKMNTSFRRIMEDRQKSNQLPPEQKLDAKRKHELIQQKKIFVFNRSCYDDLFFYCFLDKEDPAVFLEGSNRVPLFNSFSQLFLFGLQDHFRHILSSDYRSFHKYSKSPIDEKSEKAKLLRIRLAIAEEDGINLDLD